MRQEVDTRTISLMSMLIALSVAGRVMLSSIPNVQPTTVIVILSSFILSPAQAFVVALLGALISNMFLGMGYWTIYQIAIWGVIGILSGLLGKHHRVVPLPLISLYAGACGILYGFLISIPMSHLIGVNFWTYYIAGLPFDISHSVGNVIFMTLLYSQFIKLVDVFFPEMSRY